ncbi:MAG: type II toxin-antitoxin system RelE/ParE family toxin [Sphingobacteriales bacterium]|nr:type II toxin-antitoxin system RelE/ParE family toxin [Sphingobacteriales bacterium]
MGYEVKTISVFEKQAARLARKYPSFKKELLQLIQSLKQNPEQGISLGKHCYKIRMAIASKGKGKSGGTRVITNIVISNKIVYLLSVFDKSEKDNITNTELYSLLKYIIE